MLALAGLILGAFLYRWRGGPAWLPAPTIFKRGAFAILLSAGPLWELSAYWSLWPEAVVQNVLLVVLGGLWAVGLGHGAYIDLAAYSGPPNPKNKWVEPYDEEPEFAWLRLLIRSGEIRGSRMAYETLAMTVTGLAITLPAAVVYTLAGLPLSGLAILAAGALKGPCYWAGHAVSPGDGGHATRLAEWATGACIGLVSGVLL